MSETGPVVIRSRDNALLKDLRRLAQDNGAYRKQGRVWIEGDHLCRAALARGWHPALAVFSESFWPAAPAKSAQAAMVFIAATSDPASGSLSANAAILRPCATAGR